MSSVAPPSALKLLTNAHPPPQLYTNQTSWESIKFPYQKRDKIERVIETNLKYNRLYYTQTNYTKHFTYKDQVFYSYREPIAFVTRNHNGEHAEVDTVIILGKNSKFGDYYSKTTSVHIGKLKTTCEMYNIKFIYLNKEWNMITTPNTDNKLKKKKLLKYVCKSKDCECAICLESGDMKPKCKLNCNHIFHMKCVKKWFKEKGQQECPLCKQIHADIEGSINFGMFCMDNYDTGLLEPQLIYPQNHPEPEEEPMILNILESNGETTSLDLNWLLGNN